MAKVYAQSYRTLAGLSSSDSTEGLRMSGNGRTDNNLIIDLSVNDAHHGLFNARIFSEEPTGWQEEYDGWSKPANHFGTNGHKKESPLRYRAWVLQERELSTRSIHFGFKQLLWECRELKGNSELPWYQIMNVVERAELDREREWAKSHPEGSILFIRMSARWLNLSQDYSNRYLTKETDKLPALSGIAQSFQKYFPNDKYIAGIWTCHLPLALLWKPLIVATERYTTEYIAPSWSWTSHPSMISYGHSDVQELFWQKVSKTSDSVGKWFDEPEVVNITGQPKLGDDYGALKKGAALELRGAHFLELDSDVHLSECYTTVYFRKDGERAGSFLLDAPGPVEGKLLCLGIFYSPGEFLGGVTGLILREHIRDGSPVYSRVGYVSQVDSLLWNGLERRQITLI